MYQRYVATPITEALKDTPVILINGARQTGKSTLCRQLVSEGVFDGQNMPMDDPTTLAAALADPLRFLQDLSPHAIIDEVQRAPQLFLSIKKVVDENRKERRIILTGSADVMTLPQVADSLAGRIEIHHLWPLSQAEILGKRSKFLNTLVTPDGRFHAHKSNWKDIIEAIRAGGYPEALQRQNERRQNDEDEGRRHDDDERQNEKDADENVIFSDELWRARHENGGFFFDTAYLKEQR